MEPGPRMQGAHVARMSSSLTAISQTVFVYVKEGLGGRTFEVPKEAIKLDQSGCRYHPHVMEWSPARPISIINSDPPTHTLHPTPKTTRGK